MPVLSGIAISDKATPQGDTGNLGPHRSKDDSRKRKCDAPDNAFDDMMSHRIRCCELRVTQYNYIITLSFHHVIQSDRHQSDLGLAHGADPRILSQGVSFHIGPYMIIHPVTCFLIYQLTEV